MYVRIMGKKTAVQKKHSFKERDEMNLEGELGDYLIRLLLYRHYLKIILKFQEILKKFYHP
ncbi:MAG: hypothetical protein IJO99_04515 [Ruminococcus sp.]|nr:hypothetical protein [Ruminococcus sp.]